MKTFYSTIIFIAFSTMMSCAQNTAVENIDAKKFKALSEKGDGIILDVRTTEEINQGHIKNASFIDFYDTEFKNKLDMMRKDVPVFVYCKVGGRSSQAAEMMMKSGFKKVYQLDGGIMAWQQNNFEIVKPEGVADEKIQQMTLNDFHKLLETKQPVLVDFHTKWCAPCKKMAPVVDKISEEYKGKATVLRIDLDKSTEVKNHYKIQGVPVFIIFKNGEQKWKYNGMISEEELKKMLAENL